MVEVAENDVDTLVLLAKKVLDGHLYVVKGNISSTGGGGVRGLDGLGLNTFSSLNKQNAQGIARSHTSDKVVAEHTVGDPFLCSVDDLDTY